MHHVTTFTEFLLEEYRTTKNHQLAFLLIQIENATKIIASHVRKSGLADILGRTGTTNVSGDEVQKLDLLSNTILTKTLLESGQVFAVASEELENPLFAGKEKAGDYIVFYDPLDGSSNIDSNMPIGTIFSIYHKDGGLLQKGNKQIAAGYVLYGGSTTLVLAIENGVYGFTFDPAMGSFLLSAPHMKVPEKGKIYSINEANAEKFFDETATYLKHIKTASGYKARYVGTFIADFHRTVVKGGIFLYPATKDKPLGKLRRMYEGNPAAFIIHQAGGIAVTNTGENPLLQTPKDVHEQTSLIIGSPENIKEYLQFIKKPSSL